LKTFARSQKIALALDENSEPGRIYTLDALRLRVAPLPPFPLALLCRYRSRKAASFKIWYNI